MAENPFLVQTTYWRKPRPIRGKLLTERYSDPLFRTTYAKASAVEADRKQGIAVRQTVRTAAS